MTKEEAVKVLSSGGWCDCIDPDGSDADLDPLDEAIDVAISALRAQQGPAKLDRIRWDGCVECYEEHRGCQVCVHAARREELEPCKSCVKRYQDSDGEEQPGFRTTSYCPFCGKPLTEEAWAELERRLFG